MFAPEGCNGAPMTRDERKRQSDRITTTGRVTYV
jgi:hypothetical protein